MTFFARLHFAAVPALVCALAAAPAQADGYGSNRNTTSQNMPSTMPMGGPVDGHAQGSMDRDDHDETFAFGMPGHQGDVSRTIRIDMMDNAYSLDSLAVRPGETVRFVIQNRDDFTHEFVLGPSDMMAEHRADMMAMVDQGMDIDTMMHDDPNAVTIPAMQTRSFVWTFGEPSRIEFACNIPGHYEAGMHGDIAIMGTH